MNGIDIVQIAVTVIGGLGIGTFLATYVQLRDQRKQRGQEYFRQLVLTDQFLEALGTLGRMVLPLSQIKEKGSREVALELKVLLRLSKQQLDAFRNSGRTLLLHHKLVSLINDITTSISGAVDGISRYEHDELFATGIGLTNLWTLGIRIEQLSQELRRLTGINELE